jgi:DNA repair protein RecN (Recombination protein N)
MACGTFPCRTANINIDMRFEPQNLNAESASHPECYASTNPVQPLQPFTKVAFGCELSRIVLTI